MKKEQNYKFKMDVLNIASSLNLDCFEAVFSLPENASLEPVISCEYNDMYSFLSVSKYSVSDPAVIETFLFELDCFFQERPYDEEYCEALMRLTKNRELNSYEKGLLVKAVAMTNFSIKHKAHAGSYNVITSTVRSENDVHHDCLLPIQLALFFMSAEDDEFARFKERYIEALYNEVAVIRCLLDVEFER